jgi:hypothetical protein
VTWYVNFFNVEQMVTFCWACKKPVNDGKPKSTDEQVVELELKNKQLQAKVDGLVAVLASRSINMKSCEHCGCWYARGK